MRSVLKICAVMLLAATAWAQQDIFVSSGNLQPYLVLQRGAAWGSSGIGGVNNNYLFRPISQDESLCVYVTNSNPTSSHSVTVGVQQAGDPSVTSYIGNTAKWQAINTIAVQPVTISAGATNSFYFRATGSALMLVQLSGATTQAGSPDTADLFVVQTNQGCGNAANLVNADGQQASGVSLTQAQQFPVMVGGIRFPEAGSGAVKPFAVGGFGDGFPLDGPNALNYIGSTVNFSTFHAIGAVSGSTETSGIIANVPITAFGSAASGNLVENYTRTNVLEVGTNMGDFGGAGMVSFFVQGKLTNPGNNAVLLHSFSTGSATKNLQYKTLTLDCSVACELIVSRTTAQGTTCTALTPKSMNIYGGSRASATAGDVAENACATGPTLSDTLYDLTLNNVPFVVDLAGFVNMTSTGAGLIVEVVSSFTGTANATLEWVELN